MHYHLPRPRNESLLEGGAVQYSQSPHEQNEPWDNRLVEVDWSRNSVALSEDPEKEDLKQSLSLLADVHIAVFQVTQMVQEAAELDAWTPRVGHLDTV